MRSATVKTMVDVPDAGLLLEEVGPGLVDLCSATGIPISVSAATCFAGEMVQANALTDDIFTLIAAGPIPQYSPVELAAAGRVAAPASGTAIGRSIRGASAAGDRVDVAIQLAEFLGPAVGGTVVTPTITPPGGSVTSVTMISLATSTAGSVLRYTLDGLAPDSTSTIYFGPFTPPPGVAAFEVRVVATRTGMTDSEIAVASFTVSNGTVADPVITPNGGTISSQQEISIRSATTNASIRYTTDGSTPTSTVGRLYTGVIKLEGSAVVKAIGYAPLMNDSQVVSANFVVGTGIPGEPVSPPSGLDWPVNAPPITVTKQGDGTYAANVSATDYANQVYTLTYYISPTGSNANDGLTAGTPLANFTGIYSKPESRINSWKAVVAPGRYLEGGGSGSPMTMPIRMKCEGGRALFLIRHTVANSSASAWGDDTVFPNDGSTVQGAVSHSGACYKWTGVGIQCATMTNRARTSNVATITTAAAHNLKIGQWVYVNDPGSTTFTGMHRVISVPTATSFTYASPGGDVTSASTGTVWRAMNYVLDLTDLNDVGVPNIMVKVADATECIATPRSWYFNGIDVYFHLFDGRAPDANVAGVDNNDGFMASCQAGYYLENITVIGGKKAFQMIGATPSDSHVCASYNCAFLCVSSGESIGVQPAECTDGIYHYMDRGLSIHEKFMLAYVIGDGMNYAPAVVGSGTTWVNFVGIEIDCTVYDCGTFEPTGANNCTTCHKGIKVTRVGGKYVYAGDKCIADIGQDGVGGGSWNVGCTVGRAVTGTTTNVSFSIGAGTPYLLGKMWLDGCMLIDGLSSNATHAEITGDAVMYVTNMDTSGWTVVGGTLTPYTS